MLLGYVMNAPTVGRLGSLVVQRGHR